MTKEMRKHISFIHLVSTIANRMLAGVDVGTGPVLGRFAVFAAIVVVTAIERLASTTALIHASKGLSGRGSDATHNEGHCEDEQ